MYGVIIAFKDFDAKSGILGSPWAGFRHFKRFIESYAFMRVTVNTVLLSLYSLLAGFPIPILLALGLNHLKNEKFKKTVQMVTYAPHFLSVVVLIGLISQLLNTRFGILNRLIVFLGGEAIDFMGAPEWFRHVFVWSGIWQNAGYDSVIYIAALTAVNSELHEASIIDGANIWQRIWYIDIPGILPTIIILFIMRMGSLFGIGFEKVFLMQTPLNLRTSEVIETYVYKVGIASGMPNFSFGAAIGLFQSVIGLILLAIVNYIARKVSTTSLW
jgi:multiple sugar transport system permease protein/putative aldouronate transport system permease protein